jgi:hypothetical protein
MTTMTLAMTSDMSHHDTWSPPTHCLSAPCPLVPRIIKRWSAAFRHAIRALRSPVTPG